MKKVSAFVLVLLISLTSLTQAQDMRKPASPRITAESPNKMIKVAYGQPSRKGRVLFGDNGLEKYGKVWRTGANESTEITFAKDVMFGGKMVKAGSYTLFTIPGATEWTVILNSELGQSGAFDYDKTKEKDIAQVKVPAKTGSTSVEKLTITPTNNDLTIAWGETSVMVPVKAQM
ncbi:MAG: DUF2911 domain-containing protein [Bacteroidetes bacterium]|nr:DUF2911 domain-containing protein [Fibrella sp.]